MNRYRESISLTFMDPALRARNATLDDISVAAVEVEVAVGSVSKVW